MTAVTLKPTMVATTLFLFCCKALCLFLCLHLSSVTLAQETINQFRVPPHIDQQLWNESMGGMIVNTGGSMLTNLGTTIFILTAGRMTSQFGSGYLPSLLTFLLSQGVMRGIDGIRDYYFASSGGDFMAKAAFSNPDLVPFLRHLPKSFQFSASLGYNLKDYLARLFPKKHMPYTWVYFHDPELNDNVSIIWIPPELADQYDNTAPGQGYFRVIPGKNDIGCERLQDSAATLKASIQQLACKTADEEFYFHLYPRHWHGENQLFLRPFRKGVAGRLYLSPYFYGDGLTSTFISEQLKQNFQDYSDGYFNSTEYNFAETADQCLTRNHFLNANPLHQTTFQLMAALLELSQQRWLPRFELFRTLSQELDYAETLDAVPSWSHYRLQFHSLESKNLTLVSTGNQGYLSIDHHKNLQHQIIMSLETAFDLEQVHVADLEELQQQRDALWSENWQLIFSLLAIAANYKLTGPILNSTPAKFLIEVPESSEPGYKSVKTAAPEDPIEQTGGTKGDSQNTGASGQTTGSSNDVPYKNTRSQGKKRQQSQRGDGFEPGGDETPPPKQPVSGASKVSQPDKEGLHFGIPVKTRKLNNGQFEVTEIDREELARRHKVGRRHTYEARNLMEEEERMMDEMSEDEMFGYIFGINKPTSRSSRSPAELDHSEPELNPPPAVVSTRKVHFDLSDSEAKSSSPPVMKNEGGFELAEELVPPPETSPMPPVETDVQEPVSEPVQPSGPVTRSKQPKTVSSTPDPEISETYYCPFDDCSSITKGGRKPFPTIKKLRTHINSHISVKFFKAGKSDINIGSKMAAAQGNIACRIDGCNIPFDGVTELGSHLRQVHPDVQDIQPFNEEFTARYDDVKAQLDSAPKPKRGPGRPRKNQVSEPALPELKGQEGFNMLLTEAEKRGIKTRYVKSEPLSKMSPGGAGKNYVTRYGDNWRCVDCNSGLLHTPEEAGRHFLNVHMHGEDYWCPAASGTHRDERRPSFRDEQEYYQHLWSHKPEDITDEQARTNGWIPLTDLNPFTLYVPPSQ